MNTQTTILQQLQNRYLNELGEEIQLKKRLEDIQAARSILIGGIEALQLKAKQDEQLSIKEAE